MIYFLKAKDKVKIGYTDNPLTRVADIKVSCPDPIEVLLIIEGFYDKERQLHRFFKKDVSYGEWFYFSPEIKEFINENLIYDRKYEFGFSLDDFKGNNQIERLRNQHNLTLRELGFKLNITPQSVKETQEREKEGTITINSLSDIGRVLGYKLEYRFVPIN